MSNYTKSTNFATKDNLTPGDPLKVVRGTEIDTEFNNISTAIATKTDNSAAAITGGSITGITDLAIADGGTGASTATAAINNLLPAQTSAANKYLQSDGTNVSWDAVTLSTSDITGTLAVANGGTGVTSSTGTGSVVLSNSPTLVTPALGTPTSGVATNLTGLPISTGVSGLGTGVATFLGTPSSANLASAVSDETGSGALVFANSPTLVTPALGTPSALVGTNITGTASGLTAGNVTTNANLTGAVTSVGNATSLGSFSSSQLAGALTDETGSGANVFATSPTLVTPVLGVATATSLQGIIGNVTPAAGAFTTVDASGAVTLSGGTANGVTYLNGSKVLTSGSALTFDGSKLTVTGATGASYLVLNAPTDGGYASLQVGGTTFADFGSFKGINGTGSATDLYIGTRSTNNLIFGTNFTEGLRLTSTSLYTASGINVGIGTSSPATKLHVSGQSRVADSSNAANYMTFGVGANAPYGNASISTTTAGLAIVAEGAGNITFRNNGSEALRIDTANNLGLGVTPSAWSTGKALEVGAVGCGFWTPSAGNIWSTSNAYYDTSLKYAATGYAASAYQQASGVHYWYTAPSGTAGNAISFTQALTLTADGNLVAGDTATSFRMNATVPSGANRDIFGAQISGASNGFTVKWNHSTSTTRVNIQNLPTSASGLASGDLYVLAGALMVA